MDEKAGQDIPLPSKCVGILFSVVLIIYHIIIVIIFFQLQIFSNEKCRDYLRINLLRKTVRRNMMR